MLASDHYLPREPASWQVVRLIQFDRLLRDGSFSCGRSAALFVFVGDDGTARTDGGICVCIVPRTFQWESESLTLRGPDLLLCADR